MEDLWKSRRPPEALDLDALLAPAGNDSAAAAANGAPAVDASTGTGSVCKALGLSDSHAVWDVRQNAQLFLKAVELFLDERPHELGSAQVGLPACMPAHAPACMPACAPV